MWAKPPSQLMTQSDWSPHPVIKSPLLIDTVTNAVVIIEIQGEYLRVQPQGESGNSEPIYAGIATRRFDNVA